MPLDLGHGKSLDDAPGTIGVVTWKDAARASSDTNANSSRIEYPALPDSITSDPNAGRVDPRDWFHDPSRPLELEIGCGKGTFILEQSGASPAINYLGIEWTREFYMYTADRLRRAQRINVRMLHADASDFLRWRCPDRTLDVIHLYFSDPWPKSKHHKNRVVQHRFLAEVCRTLKPNGELRVVTDHDQLWEWCSGHFALWANNPVPPTGDSPSLRLHADSNTADGSHRPLTAAAGGTDAASYHARVHDAATAFLATLPSPPLEILPFTPPQWVGEGCVVGTNYEKKMCVAASKQAYSCVLKKR